ncbi:AbrB/MazE/SpoVT family DNA-binding domain-containing protein [Acidithiobacillus sp.]
MDKVTICVSKGGRLVLPAQVRQSLGIKEGDRLTLRIADQAIVLQPRHAALQKARQIVRQRIPKGESLVDALIAARRQEAQTEGQ